MLTPEGRQFQINLTTFSCTYPRDHCDLSIAIARCQLASPPFTLTLNMLDLDFHIGVCNIVNFAFASGLNCNCRCHGRDMMSASSNWKSNGISMFEFSTTFLLLLLFLFSRERAQSTSFQHTNVWCGRGSVVVVA